MDLLIKTVISCTKRSWLKRGNQENNGFMEINGFYGNIGVFMDLSVFSWILEVLPFSQIQEAERLHLNDTDHLWPVKLTLFHKLPVKRRRRVGFLSVFSKTWCTESGPLLKLAPPHKHTRDPGNESIKGNFNRPIGNLTVQSLISSNRLGYTEVSLKDRCFTRI